MITIMTWWRCNSGSCGCVLNNHDTKWYILLASDKRISEFTNYNAHYWLPLTTTGNVIVRL
jgi:hypothetical protein